MFNPGSADYKYFFVDTSVIIDDIGNLMRLLKDPENVVFITDTNTEELNALAHKRSHSADLYFGVTKAKNFFYDVLSRDANLEKCTLGSLGLSALPRKQRGSIDDIVLIDFSEQNEDFVDALLSKYAYTTKDISGKLVFANHNLFSESNSLPSFSPDLGENDLAFISSALGLKKHNPLAEIKLLTLDKTMIHVGRLNSLAFGDTIFEEPYEGRKSPDSLPRGYSFFYYKDFFSHNIEFNLTRKGVNGILLRDKSKLNKEILESLIPGQYVIFLDPGVSEEFFFTQQESVFNNTKPAYPLPDPKNVFRYNQLDEVLEPLDSRILNNQLSFLHSSFQLKSFESLLLLDAFLDQRNRFFILYGKAGTGKTYSSMFLSLISIIFSRNLAGKDSIYRDPYAKLFLSKPRVTTSGEEHETVKGGIAQKHLPYMLSFKENYDKIRMRLSKKDLPDILSSIAYDDISLERYNPKRDNESFVRILPVSTIKGRTFNPNDIIIVDEAEDLPKDLATYILSRSGGTRICFVGDPYQVSERFNSPNYNGITKIIYLSYRNADAMNLDKNTRNRIIGFQQSIKTLRFTNTQRSDNHKSLEILFGAGSFY